MKQLLVFSFVRLLQPSQLCYATIGLIYTDFNQSTKEDFCLLFLFSLSFRFLIKQKETLKSYIKTKLFFSRLISRKIAHDKSRLAGSFIFALARQENSGELGRTKCGGRLSVMARTTLLSSNNQLLDFRMKIILSNCFKVFVGN